MQNLFVHQQRLADVSLRQLFAEDPERAQRYQFAAAGLQLNASRNLLDGASWQALLAVAEQADLPGAAAQLFADNQLNATEQRAVHHPALRSPAPTAALQAQIDAAKAQMAEIVDQVHSGRWSEDVPITDVVNIGVGGSDHGAAMSCHALRHLDKGVVRCHFVSNMDGDHIQHVLARCNPAQTLFVIVSKSFSTLETKVNTDKAIAWLTAHHQDSDKVAQHVIAVTAQADKAAALGIKHVLPIWSWVGGRYSIWSSVGLCVALQIGWPAFEAMLEGAAAMDQHVQTAPLAENLPMILALLAVWYRLWGAETLAVIPYSDGLSLLPTYLQQLHMESLGKHVDVAGKPLAQACGQVVWGGAGSVSQHTFHQFLLQSDTLVPVDFILPLTSHGGDAVDDARVVANCLSQARLLMHGYSMQEASADLGEAATALAAHKVIVGNRPSNLISMPKVTPASLGALLALYEHKVYLQAVLWGMNAFDQWGVERGKLSAEQIFQALCVGEVPAELDGATQLAMQALLKEQDNDDT